MHNLTKIKLFRILLLCSYPLAIIFVYPFVFFRKLNPSGYFFFFDRYVIGGAQKVHIDVLQAISETNKQVFFTRYSPNDKLKEAFLHIPNTSSHDIHTWCDNLLFRLFTVHYFAFYINRHTHAIIFSSNSTFFYDMLFFLNKRHMRVELLHNFTYGNNGMEFFGLANHKYLNYRLVVDDATRRNIIQQYREHGVPEHYTEQIILIEPGVDVPEQITKDYNLPIKVLYAGRGGPQKRIYLLDRIATEIIKKNISIEFHFAGTMMDELSDFVKQHSIIHGEISSQEAMYQLYKQCHVLLMTSAYEGFPMLIKEGMANGCIPVVTALEGNKMHLANNINALMITEPEDEDNVVEQGVKHLETLANYPEKLMELSTSCHKYAKERFDKSAFIRAYRTFFYDTIT